MLNVPGYTAEDYRQDCADRKEFQAILDRIAEAAGVSDEAGFAELFNVRISTFLQACRECRLEKRWVEQLCSRYSLHPEWVLTGEGQKFLLGMEHA